MYHKNMTYPIMARFPITKKNEKSTSIITSFYGRFSVLNILTTPFKLNNYNCSYRHHCESMVHNGSMMEIVLQLIILSYFTVCLFIVEVHVGISIKKFIIQILDYSFLSLKNVIILLVNLYNTFFLFSSVVSKNILYVK